MNQEIKYFYVKFLVEDKDIYTNIIMNMPNYAEEVLVFIKKFNYFFNEFKIVHNLKSIK